MKKKQVKNNTGKEGNDTLEESPVPETISDVISLESLKISETTATKKEEIIAIEIKTQTEEKENSEESGDDNKIIAKKVKRKLNKQYNKVKTSRNAIKSRAKKNAGIDTTF